MPGVHVWRFAYPLLCSQAASRTGQTSPSGPRGPESGVVTAVSRGLFIPFLSHCVQTCAKAFGHVLCAIVRPEMHEVEGGRAMREMVMQGGHLNVVGRKRPSYV